MSTGTRYALEIHHSEVEVTVIKLTCAARNARTRVRFYFILFAHGTATRQRAACPEYRRYYIQGDLLPRTHDYTYLYIRYIRIY